MDIWSFASPKMNALLIALTYLVLMKTEVEGHGRLIDPPSRSSMWRYGFKTPANYDDNSLYCGGFDVSTFCAFTPSPKSSICF